MLAGQQQSKIKETKVTPPAGKVSRRENKVMVVLAR
jgi:hypothetical protein